MALAGEQHRAIPLRDEQRACGKPLTGIAAFLFAIGVSLLAIAALADPIKMRCPEGPTHGFLVLSDMSGTPLAHGELIQWLEERIVASRLIIRFDDGSLYDEIVRFSQNPVFRLVSYKLVQRGPSFRESADVQFDRSGRYRVRRRPAPEKEEEEASGHVDLPEDVSNGMASILLKNLGPGKSASVHFVSFGPKPRLLRLELAPEGSDRFWIGRTTEEATRFSLKPEVTGVTGVVATVLGKQPSVRQMWITQGKAPAVIRFEGPLYTDGPRWRVDLTAPRWQP